jgi:DNA-binding transcriptional LysR family regulator
MSKALDIDLLRTFHAVARLRKFRAAAEEVNKSPAAVSVHIRKLEEVAGGPLFERDNRSVSLTPLGLHVLACTSGFLESHDRLANVLSGAKVSGRIRLGVPDEYASRLIADVLPFFVAAYPGVELDVSTSPSLKLLDEVARDRRDLVVAVRPATRRRAIGEKVLAVTTPVWAGVAASTRAALPDPLPLAMHSAQCPYRAAMTDALDRAGIKWRSVLTSPSSQAIEACVEAGLGASLMDRSRVTTRMSILARSGLPAVSAHQVVLVRSASRANSETVELLASTIEQRFRL